MATCGRSCFSALPGAAAKKMSSRSSHTWKTTAHQLSNKTKLLFIKCWRTGRRGSDAFVTRHESWNRSPNGQNAQESVWKRGWIWCKLTYGPTAMRRATSMNSMRCWNQRKFRPCLFFEKLVGEIANTEHLFVRLRNGLWGQECNIHRAPRQLKSWTTTPCFPRPSSKDVIASFRVKKRQHGMFFSSHLEGDLPVLQCA